jgi:2-methylcitrate dehydratase PrpD
VLDWRRAHPDAQVTRVVVRGNPLMALRADRPDIASGRESQVSVQHAVAAALVTGQAGVAQFEDACVNDARVRALRARVTIEKDERVPTVAAAVTITTADGNTHALRQEAARGSDANPLSDAALEDKLRTAAAEWDADYDPTPLIAAVWSLDASADAGGLSAIAVPRG